MTTAKMFTTKMVNLEAEAKTCQKKVSLSA